MGKKSTQDTGVRFREVARRLFDGNKSELARSLGMKPSSFAKYTNGRRQPGAGILVKLSRMGININWFLSGEGDMLDRCASAPNPGDATDEQEGPETDHYPVPVVKVLVDGSGTVRFEETGAVHWLSNSFLDREYGVDPHHVRELRVSGLSLGDTIRPGDRVLVDSDCGVLNDGSVLLLRGPLGLLIRRIGLRGETVVLRKDGADAPDQAVPLEEWTEKYHSLAQILEVRHPL
jgi:phage repressor protein C with HTH and peptisase S24 domain